MKGQDTMKSREEIYRSALMLMEGQLFSEAAGAFDSISDYRDAAEKRDTCKEKAEALRKDTIYAEADKAAQNPNVRSQEKAIRIFRTIPGWRDADERVSEASRRIEEIIVKERLDRQEAIRAAAHEQQIVQKRKKRVRRLITAAAVSVAVCLLGVFVFRNVVSPALKYTKAVKLLEAEQPDEAYRLLYELDFLDSNNLVHRIAQDRLSDAEVGSTVSFGCYPQAGRSSEEKDAIEWIVLDEDNGKLLLISKYALDCLPYQDATHSQLYASWKTSPIREWLNGAFLNEAFDKGEAQFLVGTTASEDANATGFSFGDTGTSDRVFLLNIAEAEKYFPDKESRKCLPTRYAIYRGAYQSSIGRTCYWWLRSTIAYTDQSLDGMPLETLTRATLVGTSGTVVDIGHYMYNEQYTVRPAIWVDTNPVEMMQQAEVGQ